MSYKPSFLSRRSPKYSEGKTRMWDLHRDEFDSFDDAGKLDVANLSLHEWELEAVVFGDDDNDVNIEAKSMKVGSN